MIGNSKRSIRLMSWRTLRWAIAIPTLPLVWWACTSHPLTQPVPAPEQQTDIYISVSPTRLLDLVFAIDNSPSMSPKVEKLNDQFPKLIAALEDPNDNNSLPDLRVAIINSDLGTGNAYPSGACATMYGDMGKFQMIDAADCGVTSSDALWLEYKTGKPANFTGNINEVFTCLARGLGTAGCGIEHQLQAVEFALVAGGLGYEETQHKMLRAGAYLGLVFLTDEDDCSAATNYGMFGDFATDDLQNESASLRCATRAHACDGVNITDTPSGYPISAAFTAPFKSCTARVDDSCPNGTDGDKNGTDTSGKTDCSPLKSISRLAAEVKGLKDDPDQILVAGIFGWPLNDADMEQAEYKIAKQPNPSTTDTAAHPVIYDYWPVCYDPNHKPSPATTDAATGFDKTAAGFGATGGLRMAAFIDQFDNGLKFSICQPDFTDSMKTIGDTIAKKLQNLCVNYQLLDKDPNTPELDPDCRVVYRKLEDDPENPGEVIYVENSTSLPMCDPAANYSTTNPPPDDVGDCWTLTSDKDKCPEAYNGQLINVVRSKSEIAKGALPAGTKVGMQCRTCTDFRDSDGKPLKGCETL